MSNEVIAERG